MRPPLLAAVLALLPAAALPEGGPPPEAVARLAAALLAEGCLLTPDNQPRVLAAARMGEEEAGLSLARLADAGRVVQRPDGTFRLTDAACPAPPE